MTLPGSMQDECLQQIPSSAAPNERRAPPNLNIPKNRSATNLLSPTSSSASLHLDGVRARLSSIDAGILPEYDGLSRSPILTAERDTGLRRIRQQPPPISRNTSSPNLLATSPAASQPGSRKGSLTLTAVPQSPVLPFGEDLSRFPTESLHSFSFAHQTGDTIHNRQNVLKRSIEFMREKVSWAATSPRIASAQARLSGDEELLSMMELLQKANMMGVESLSGTGLGIDRGPLTGPAYSGNENIFDRSFMPDIEEQNEGILRSDSPDTFTTRKEEPVVPITASWTSSNPQMPLLTPVMSEPEPLSLSNEQGVLESRPTIPQRAPRVPLKRTYTDVGGYSLQHKLTEALAQPYHTSQPASIMSPTNPPLFTPLHPQRSNTTLSERAPHGHKNNQAQAIFMTEAKAPWTITAANDLACLVFGVTRAEVRKLGIMEVIKEERRKWLEEKLRDPESGSAQRQAKPSPVSNTTQKPSLVGMGNGVTAKLLSKPPARQTYQSRRSKTENGVATPRKEPHHTGNKSRGVLLCGDVIPIQKMNGATGSASIWVKEKSGNLIWVLEEIAEDVAILTIDEIGSIIRGTGDIQPIWGIERVRNGMDVHKLIPAFPKLAGTNTGAIDYDAVARLRRFTARTSNSISVPVTIDQAPGDSMFRVSSFPHIAGIIVVNPTTMRISSSNSVFSAALFGHADPDGMPVVDLIPGFDKILRVMTDEDKIKLVDGIVIPEHSFRRARSLLALREGSEDAAAIFLRPSGLPARHRDGAEIMIDMQMRVVKSDREPIYNETVFEDETLRTLPGSEVVFALWITYSRQLHAVNHGVGPVTPRISRPSTPPQQPGPRPEDRAPSPMVVGEISDDESQTGSSNQRSEGSKSTDGTDDMADSNEPFEHPSPDMIAAGVKLIKKKKIDDFVILEEMGQGAYGQVKLARYKKTAAKKMVIKYVTKRRILVDTWHRDRRLGTVPLEIHVLDYLRREGMQHPNIVEMADFFEDDINYYIEMVPHGLPGMDLFDYIELRVTMEESECRKIFIQVAEALRHLHINAKVVHRDIKDENVILDGEGKVKLVDFGSAAYIKSGPFDVFVGTIDYAAPEVLRGLPYRGKEQDVWALGILLYTIVYKENPFYSIDEIMDHDLRVPYVLSEECIDLIRKMLDRDVERRIGIQAVLEHDWCNMVDEEKES
ncbi:Serine/threonine-protein kinase ppk6 [Acrodontium crateriforme]|uniref:non-specific serine/threonine protein kinase n=1 Tax=Acrodontium crateriforme TaxID=150365 RepID=A0AAQ3R9V8_9PEZI|nr:Serine/threonine-protein kinase ppk6 [Acrodontium crateriforme]